MITQQVGVFRMHLDPEDGGISKVLARKGRREPCFMWILNHEARGHIGIDVGANIGYTTLSMCRTMNRVIAIEPDPRSRRLLVQNITANGFDDKTEIHDCAISDTEGQKTIYLADCPNLTTLQASAAVAGTPTQVRTRTIDSFGVDPTFIKMDIEGHEVNAIRGAMQCLQRTECCKLLIEVHPTCYEGDEFEHVLRDLLAIGFRFKYVVSAGVPQPDLFRKAGYTPLDYAPCDRRAVYAGLDPEDAIRWSSHPISQKCRRGRISPKIVRAILLTKDDQATATDADGGSLRQKVLREGHADRIRYLAAIEAATAEGLGLEVLELGCDDGTFAYGFAGLGHRVTAVDLDCSTARTTHPHPNIRYLDEDVEKLQPTGQFDIIHAGEILEHVPNPDRLMALIVQSLKPTGLIMISVPNFEHPHHRRTYSRRSFQRLLDEYGIHGTLRTIRHQAKGRKRHAERYAVYDGRIATGGARHGSWLSRWIRP